jgi:hypothetical protein
MTDSSSQLPADPALEHRRFIDAAWPRNPLDEPSVRFWRAAGRVTLAVLLGFSVMQYYFFHVHVTIMAMPGLIVFAAVP